MPEKKIVSGLNTLIPIMFAETKVIIGSLHLLSESINTERVNIFTDYKSAIRTNEAETLTSRTVLD